MRRPGARAGFSAVEVAAGAAVMAVMATGVVALLSAERAVGESVRVTHLQEVDGIVREEADLWSPPLAAEADGAVGL